MAHSLRLRSAIAYKLRRHNLPVSSEISETCRPIFVIGSGRSGNTLMRRALIEYGRVCIPPETYVLGSVVRHFLSNNHLGWEQMVEDITGKFEDYPEYPDTFGYSLNLLRERLLASVSEKRTLADMIREFYCFYGEQVSMPFDRWGDKTPLNTYSVWDIDRVFPNARYIWLVRDPVDATASYIKAGIYKDLNSAISRWVNSNQIIRKFSKSNPEKVLMVPYATLVSNFEGSVRSVCRFCDLEFRAATSNRPTFGDVEAREHHRSVLSPVTTDSIGKGRSQLDKFSVLEIDEQTEVFYANLFQKIECEILR